MTVATASSRLAFRQEIHIGRSDLVASSNMNRAYNAASATVAQVGDGSGVIVGRQGKNYYILTNAHVVAVSLGSINVVMPDGTSLTGKIVKRGSGAFGRGLDLAIVVVTDLDGKGNYSTARVGLVSADIGSTVLQAGYPTSPNLSARTLNDFGRRGQYLTPAISELRGNALEGGFNIGIDQNLGVGCSGGGVFDGNGNLVGISGRAQIGRISGSLNEGGIAKPQSDLTVGWAISNDQIRRFSHGVVPGF